nr:hypothetical protein [Tanacetum cinerariifolium]
MHERPAGKIGVYTIFFEFANFRLPLSTFLVDVLSIQPTVGLYRCFYVNYKNNRWMSFSKRSDNSSVCYTKPLDSFKHWNDHFFWVDAFACSVSFPWHIDKNVSRDPLPKSTEFNVDDYDVLVAHPAPFRKFPEPFLCLVEISRYYTLDEDTYPRFRHDDREGGFLSLYIVHLVAIQRQRKKRPAVAGASGSFHPPKKLRGDHETSSGIATGGKSLFVIKELL